MCYNEAQSVNGKRSYRDTILTGNNSNMSNEPVW